MSEAMAPAVAVIIPALNERESLPRVLTALPAAFLREVVVVDNGSTDGTADVARSRGATVVLEPRRGYGRACLTGLGYLESRGSPPDVVVFLDADYSDHPEELPLLLAPIVSGRADLVIGSRVLGRRERGALPTHARFGNLLAAQVLWWRHGVRATDLGPFRAIQWEALRRLEMADTSFGWTAEMQVKAARRGLRIVEVPVSYRRRIGVSKISGTVWGSLRAGWKILHTVLRG